jgi:hypothetical protein
LIRSWLQNINHQTVSALAASSANGSNGTKRCSCVCVGLLCGAAGPFFAEERHPMRRLGQVHEGDVHICLAECKTATDYGMNPGFPQYLPHAGHAVGAAGG